MEPIFLGLDVPALISIPLMIGLFAFAIWYGATQFSIGIDAKEQARRKTSGSAGPQGGLHSAQGLRLMGGAARYGKIAADVRPRWRWMRQ